MKKLGILILLIIISFSFFLISYFKVRNYEIKYEFKNYKVLEKYDKKSKNYYINIKKGKQDYFYIISEKYSRNRKLVKNIKSFTKDSDSCLILTFKNKKNYISCKSNDEFVSYQMINNDLKNRIKSYGTKKYKLDKSSKYKNININTLYNKKIFVWNYHGFYYLSNDNKHDIKMFNNDTYNVNLIGQIDKYLLVPNYSKEFEFNSFKILNTENLKIEDFKLKDYISFDSYIMGINEDSIFYYDTKYHKEYELVPYKKKYRTINNYIYDKGNKVNKSEVILSNNEVKFNYDVTYTYKLIDNKLYRYNKYNKDKELITNLEVKEIVSSDNKNNVYFISEDSLYVYNDLYGSLKLLEYFELNFNYKNIFYIFD